MQTILVLDDHPLVADGIRLMLKKTVYKTIIASKNTAEALLVLEKQVIDVLFLDLCLPHEDTMVFYQKIKKDYNHIKIIVLTSNEEGGTVRQFVEAGVNGYLLKNADCTEIIATIETVLKGEQYLSKIVNQNLIKSLRKPDSQKIKVTNREHDILCCLKQGMTSEQIGQKLCIATLTVDTHRRNLMQNFEVHNITSLLKAVQERNMEIS
jgi:DNA-binding NarL/FixJ family response regulator